MGIWAEFCVWGGQHYGEIFVVLVALRFGKNFEAVFGEGLHEKHAARSGFVTFNWMQDGRKSQKTVTELTVRN